jgi:hypothetical protein
MVQSHKILIGRGVSWRSFCRNNLEPLQLSVVLVGGIRDDLVEENVDGGDNLAQLGYVDLIPPIIIGIAHVEAGVCLVVQILPTRGLGLQDVGLAPPDA